MNGYHASEEITTMAFHCQVSGMQSESLGSLDQDVLISTVWYEL